MQIRRLYSEPAVFDAIEFEDGLNVILGEAGDSSRKTNSVGKSVCIDFVNFCLLKSLSESRIARIPEDVFDPATNVCLSVEAGNLRLVLKRSVKQSEMPTIICNDETTRFDSLDAARQFLGAKLCGDAIAADVSFRSLMSILIRDERSEFKEVDRPYDTKLRAPADLTPHLYLLGLNAALYRSTLRLIEDVKKTSKNISQITRDLKRLHQMTPAAARSQVNALSGELNTIERGIEQLEAVQGFDALRSDAEQIEAEMDRLRLAIRSHQEQLRRLKPIDTVVELNDEEVVEFYQTISGRLGEIVRHDLTEALEFKSRIMEFQAKLAADRKRTLTVALEELKRALAEQERSYKPILDILQKTGRLAGIKQAYGALQHKTVLTSELRSFTVQHDRLTSEKTRGTRSVLEKLSEIESDIAAHKDSLLEFEAFFLGVHELIQGNRNAHISVTHATATGPVKLNLRVDSDGGHSNNRLAVFIYDMSLLLSPVTRPRHPGVLVHDNLFASDLDTLSKSMRFIRSSFDGAVGCQYVLTLNTDLLVGVPPEDATYLDSCVRARFTKARRFLGVEYQERTPPRRATKRKKKAVR